MAKILVIEDDISLCNAIKDWLAMELHSSEFVHDGDEALQHLKVFGYDLIVLDWELPGASGLEILRDFRGRGGTTPILFLTGKDQLAEQRIRT